MRIINYEIDEKYEGRTIWQLLEDKKYSSQNLKILRRTEDGILLNGKSAPMISLLKNKDVVTVRIIESESSKHIPPVKLPLDIVYEDEDILVVNKPKDMPIHPSLNNYENSLGNAVMWYFKEQNVPFVYRCINRLDRDTSGLTIIAKHYLSGNILSNSVHKEDGLLREYLAIVEGVPNPSYGTIEAPIGRKSDSIIEREINYEKGENAVTHYEVIKSNNKYSLVRLKLETGRTHQIRVHMKYIGHPLIGDYLYNPDNKDMGRQALHSYRIEFSHPVTGERMRFECPLPEDMKGLI